jgi:integrase
MGKRIVEQTIKRMKAPEENSRIEFDSEIPGFGVRITAAGVISFILDYRTVHGRRHRRYTIGGHPELTVTAARIEASELRAKIRKGGDPMEDRNKMRSDPTMNDLVTDYKESESFQRLRPHTRRDYERMLKKIISKLGSLRLNAIGKRDIERLHASFKATPYQANRILALLSKMFNYALEAKRIAENPARGVKKFSEEKREKWLSVEQIQRFREALDKYKDQSAANCLRLLLLTGSRAGEALRAEWQEFDLTRGVWTKPTHHTKQKKTEHVPLSAPAIELLQSMRPRNAVGPLFRGTQAKGKDGKRTGGEKRVSLKRPWLQACKAAGLVETYSVKGKRGKLLTRYKPTVRLHDLRHSYASHLISNGVGLQVVGKLLGHVQASTTMRYAHVQDEAQRAATNQLAKIIAFESRKTA